MSDIQQEIARLSEEINRHNYYYYMLDDPKISDYDFDQLLQNSLTWNGSILNMCAPTVLRKG